MGGDKLYNFSRNRNTVRTSGVGVVERLGLRAGVELTIGLDRLRITRVVSEAAAGNQALYAVAPVSRDALERVAEQKVGNGKLPDRSPNASIGRHSLVREVAVDFLAHQIPILPNGQAKKANTTSKLESGYTQLLGMWGDVPIGTITKEDCIRWWERLWREEDYAASTASSNVNNLRRLMRWAGMGNKQPTNTASCVPAQRNDKYGIPDRGTENDIPAGVHYREWLRNNRLRNKRAANAGGRSSRARG